MNKKITFLLFLILTAPVFSQTGKVEGIITDNIGQPLIGVNASIKNTTKGAQTDENGIFEITNIKTCLLYTSPSPRDA